MTSPTVGTAEEHRTARLELLNAEKELTRRSDELARQRRALPWVQVDKEYVFDTERGPRALRELFAGRSQLLVYHLMFGPDWTEACQACSFWADSFDRVIVHLNHRDVTMLCVSRGPLERLHAYRRRMGWSFEWVSALANDFNFDYGVSLPPGKSADEVEYNFGPWGGPAHQEHAGLSAFTLENGVAYHTYSCYARGLEAFNAGYQLLDRTPKGRDEDALPFTFAWLQRRDEYDDVGETAG
jgi:predicted dithiol-disulfide oxidoreductase (DUF899 family)